MSTLGTLKTHMLSYSTSYYLICKFKVIVRIIRLTADLSDEPKGYVHVGGTLQLSPPPPPPCNNLLLPWLDPGTKLYCTVPIRMAFFGTVLVHPPHPITILRVRKTLIFSPSYILHFRVTGASRCREITNFEPPFDTNVADARYSWPIAMISKHSSPCSTQSKPNFKSLSKSMDLKLFATKVSNLQNQNSLNLHILIS